MFIYIIISVAFFSFLLLKDLKEDREDVIDDDQQSL